MQDFFYVCVCILGQVYTATEHTVLRDSKHSRRILNLLAKDELHSF